MKKMLTLFSCAALLLQACAGEKPNPVPQYQPGDEYMTCSQIQLAIADNNTKIMGLVPKQEKTGKNVALGVAGAFLIVPWFFMDFSDAERIEVQGYQLRNNWLTNLAQKKHCSNITPGIRFAGQK